MIVFLIVALSLLALIMTIFAASAEPFDNPPRCDVALCNATLKDWIVRKYWAFDDSSKLAECGGCPPRWFRAPMDVSWDGVNYTTLPGAQEAAEAVRVDRPPTAPAPPPPPPPVEGVPGPDMPLDQFIALTNGYTYGTRF